jgi:hypothetical protein
MFKFYLFANLTQNIELKTYLKIKNRKNKKEKQTTGKKKDKEKAEKPTKTKNENREKTQKGKTARWAAARSVPHACGAY